MAATPKYKVFNPSGEHVASCKEPEAAGALTSFYGYGATIRLDHSKAHTLWTEGADGSSGESYDAVAKMCDERERAIHRALYLKVVYGRLPEGVK